MISQDRMPGALIISLDFELLWGMRDICSPDHPYIKNLYNERVVIPCLLKLFAEFNIAATWAIVGFLFAQNRKELQQFYPAVRPQYKKGSLSPYSEIVGENEVDDPLHYAYEIIQEIKNARRQEIATHTFSHYYCLEEGQTQEAFAADLDSALCLARMKGLDIKTIIFPRHQYNREYDQVLLEKEILCYRGNERHYIYQVEGPGHNSFCKRLYMHLDSYLNLSGKHLFSWQEIVQQSGLCNIPASRFLRPVGNSRSLLSRRKFQRIVQALEEAARLNKIFHLWWHPHNFGLCIEENISFLQDILEFFDQCRNKYGMISLSMREAAEIAKNLPGCAIVGGKDGE